MRPTAEYRIRKVGRLWMLDHRHWPNGGWHGPIAQSSYWTVVMWIATGDPSYRMPGFMLMPSWCSG